MRTDPARVLGRAPARTVFVPAVQKVGLALLAAAAVHSGAASGAAAPSATARFHTFSGAQRFKPAHLPLGARQSEEVTVVVQMSADPVAGARAQAPDHKITRAQHDAIAAQIAQQQATIEPEIIARGGRVLAHFHDAINGVKVRIRRDQLPALKSAPGVVDVLPVRKYHFTNAESVPFIGAPLVWQGTPAYHGEGMKIAVIDTGIDYTHANFGGPGTVEAFNNAVASSTQPADPKLFGPGAPKVKGGTDLVGDDYNADDPNSVPQPDPNPLDCNGHGSHTAGTAAGFGVAADGTTYKGPYNSTAYSQNFLIGPGVAPKADLYSVRVFGCAGSTNVVVDAINWAIHNDMDVISMSLGSDFGTGQDADAVASTNATRAGIIVAAASGNSGPVPYITSTPAASAEAISVAAVDSHESFPGAAVTLDNGTVEAQDSNGVQLPAGPIGVVVLRTSTGGVSLGCDESEYANGNVAGKLVVTLRGVCDRVQRPKYGQKYGAAAVAMINTSPGYPPYEGPIGGVTIPFLGILPSDAAKIGAATTATSFTANTIANPSYRTAASFSSGGPRFGDSLLKPNVSAPGVSIFSTAMGTGNGGLFESGTSMATPHVAGVAALAAQAHPKWSEAAVSAAVVETADPKQLTDYTTGLEGAGLVQPVGATRTQAVVFAGTSGGEHALSFGFEEFVRNFRTQKELVVHNYGDSTIVFNVTSTSGSAVPHTLSFNHTVTVRPHSQTELEVSLTVPVATVGATHDANGNDLFEDVGGYLTFTPASPGMNNGVTLNVPYYLVPRARSDVFAVLTGALSSSHPNGNVMLANVLGGISGLGDFYAWGLSNRPQGLKDYDTRAVGVQSIPFGNDRIVVFAINTFKRFSSAEGAEFDVLIDVNGDGRPDFDLVAVDIGLLSSAPAFTGEYVAALIDLNAQTAVINFYADAPTDGSTVLLPVFASDMGLSASNPRFTYAETTYDLFNNTSASMPGSASFNAFAPSISNGVQVSVAPNRIGKVPVVIDPKEWAKTPALGLMVVVEDNTSGEPQANLLSVRH